MTLTMINRGVKMWRDHQMVLSVSFDIDSNCMYITFYYMYKFANGLNV